MIEVKNVSKKYRNKLAVDNVSFEVAPGKVTGFLGPNGAGKSTTMRVMLGLDIGTGSTFYDDKTLYSYESPASVVGILLEAKAFHPSRKARDHLSVLATMGNIPKSRVDEVLEIVGLSDVAGKRPGKFSLGMSQRLGIAAAILGNPKYLILDEPANGLDPEGMAWLRKFIKDYAKAGNGVLISSHLLSEISQIADNIVVIGKGKLIANTTVKNLVSGGAHTTVFVRSSKLDLLKSALDKAKIGYQSEGEGLEIHGVNSDKVGEIAFSAKAPVLELMTSNVSLEEAFLELTADSQEYQAKGDKK